MILLVRIEIDDAKANATNANLYDPEHDDPVVGDGRSLTRDLVQGGSLGDLLDDCDFVTKTTITLDDEVIA